MTTGILGLIVAHVILAVPASASLVVSWETEDPWDTYSFNESAATFGYSFVIGSSDLLVSSLGYWDAGNNGLRDVHAVGVWNASGDLLGSVEVQSGTDSHLQDTFRYEDVVAPFTLRAHETYVIGGFSPFRSGDPFWAEIWTVELGAGIDSLGAPVVTWGDSLLYPDTPRPDRAFVIEKGHTFYPTDCSMAYSHR
jgi:hypothetical protein